MQIPIIENNVVINVIEIEEGAAYELPDGQTFGEIGGQIGDTWDGTGYLLPDTDEVIVLDES